MHRSNGSRWLASAFVALFAPLVANQALAGAAEYLLPVNGDNVIGVVTTAMAESRTVKPSVLASSRSSLIDASNSRSLTLGNWTAATTANRGFSLTSLGIR